MSSDLKPTIPSSPGQPTWEAVTLLPLQGEWTEADYFELSTTNRLVELADGLLEVLPMPTWLHQLMVDFFLDAIKGYLKANNLGGRVLFAPLPVRLFPGTIREPDIFYIASNNLPKPGAEYPDHVDFVIEVVSKGPEARRRDYEHKPIDYAKAGIAEYWIVDPIEKRVLVLGLKHGKFETLGAFEGDQLAAGQYFPGFKILPAQVFALADQDPGQA